MKRFLIAALLMSAGALQAQTYSITTAQDVVYDTVDGIELKMDVYEPVGTMGARPLVIAIHGGCFTAGDKKDMNYLAESLAKQGMVVANVNYRLAGQAVYPAAHDDVRAALRYMREKGIAFNIDQNRVASIGTSAGSTLAAALGVEPAYNRAGGQDAFSQPVNVVMDNFGRMDFTHDQYAPDLNRLDCAERYLGMKREVNPQAFFDASPINKVTAETARFIITHGLSDPYLPPLHAQRMHQRILEKGGKSTLVLAEGVGHSLPWTAFLLSRALVKQDFAMPYSLSEDTSAALRIDAGSSAAPAPVEGYLSDRLYQAGYAGMYDPQLYPASDPVAQTVRQSKKSFGYDLPSGAAGLKKVSMTFFEPYNVGKGYRMQDVRIHGVDAFVDLDIVKINGKGRSVMKQDVYFLNKTENMRWEFFKKGTQSGNAAIGAIEVTPVLVK